MPSATSLPSATSRPGWRERLRDAALRVIQRVGWRLGPRLPRRVGRLVMTLGSRYAVARNGAHVQHLRRNLTIATGAPADDALVRAAVASHLRNFLEVLALPGWTAERIRAIVSVENRAALDAAMAGPGAIVVLPHSGNWDLAGAWGCCSGVPLTTVAEQLGELEFSAYRRFRESLGLEVISHQDSAALRRLTAALAAGRVVCLVADRDLPGTGLPVPWGVGGPVVTLPAGPALLARRTGAALIPGVARFVGRDAGDGLVVTLGDPVPAEPGAAGLGAMTGAVAAFFAEQIARAPQDWHLLQPFFPARAT